MAPEDPPGAAGAVAATGPANGENGQDASVCALEGTDASAAQFSDVRDALVSSNTEESARTEPNTGEKLNVDPNFESSAASDAEKSKRSASDANKPDLSHKNSSEANQNEEEQDVRFEVEKGEGLDELKGFQQPDDIADDDDAGSVVEVPVVESPSSDAGENAKENDHFLYASLSTLVNDRMAEATIKLHIMTGAKLTRLVLFSLLMGLFAAVLSGSGVALSKDANFPPGTKPGGRYPFDVMEYFLVLRVLMSVFMTGSVLFFTKVVVYDLRWRAHGEIPTEKIAIRLEAQAVVLLMAWFSWLLPALNPVATVTDLYALIVANRNNNFQEFLDFWPRQRYSSIASSLYVSFSFYMAIYLFKWIRLESIKRDRWLRISLQHDGSAYRRLIARTDALDDAQNYDRVRSLRGIVPRITAIYVVLRLVFTQAFNFTMGFVPGIAWISVIRFCTGDTMELMENPCTESPSNAKAAFAVLFSIADLVLIWWVFKEARRAKRFLSLYYLLQGRANLTSFQVVTISLFISFFMQFILAIAVASSVSEPLFFFEGLNMTGISFLGAPLGFLVFSWVSTLVYLFTPCTYRFIPQALREEEDTGYLYVKSYVDCAFSALGDTYVVEQLDVLAEHEEQTTFTSTEMESSANLTPEMIADCLKNSSGNIFSFDMCALLWNFACITYHAGNGRHPQSDADVMLLVEEEQMDFTLQEQIHGDNFDTYAAIFSASEMIVVTFRGNGSKLLEFVTDFVMMAPSEISTSEISSVAGPNGDATESPFTRGSQIFFQSVSDSLEATGCCRTRRPLVRADLYSRYESLRLRVIEVVKQLLDQNPRPVFLTGHGVGGAFAAFAANDVGRLPNHLQTPISVYTFGAPVCCNHSFANAYENRIHNHFDIANVSDGLHSMHRRRLGALQRRDLVHIGTLVLVDSLGNLVINPDWLEIELMNSSRRKKLNAHEPLAYTSGMMQWAHRMYGVLYRPIWSPALHEIKSNIRALESRNLVHNLDEEIEQRPLEGWQASVVRSYLRTSKVGLLPYMDEACIRVRVLRISGLSAKQSICIISCGPQGISSSLWEVCKTEPASLQHRSTLQLDTLGNDASIDGASQHDRTLGKSNTIHSVGFDPDALDDLPARFAEFNNSPPMFFGTYQKLRPCATLTIAGNDTSLGTFGTAVLPIAKLFPIPDSPKVMHFELSGRARGENDGDLKVTLEVQDIGGVKLKDLSREYQIETMVTARASGDTANSKHAATGAKRISRPMATLYLNCNFNRNSQRVVIRVGLLRAALRTLSLALSNGRRASHVYAIIKLLGERPNGNVLEISRSKGLEDVHDPIWNEVFTFGRIHSLTGFEELRIEILATEDDDLDEPVHIEEPVLHGVDEDGSSAGHHATQSAITASPFAQSSADLLAFGGPLISLAEDRGRANVASHGRFASWTEYMSSPHAANTVNHGFDFTGAFFNPVLTMKQPSENDKVLGYIVLPLSRVLSAFQDSLLLKWITLDPERENEGKSDETDMQLPGHICVGFEVAAEPLSLDKFNQSRFARSPGSSIYTADEALVSSPGHTSMKALQGTGRMMVRQASGGLRNIMNLASPIHTAGRRGSSTSASSMDARKFGESFQGGIQMMPIVSSSKQQPGDKNCVLSQQAPDEWKLRANRNFDERGFVVLLYIVRAENLKEVFEAESPALPREAVDEGNDDETDFAIDPFCEIALLDPLNEYEETLKQKSSIIRDSTAPEWKEEFRFGEERDMPVRGNEILSIKVSHWDLREKFCFGEFRMEISSFRNKLSRKESRTELLRNYDCKGKPLPNDAALRALISFSVMVQEFENPDTVASRADEAACWQGTRSPML